MTRATSTATVGTREALDVEHILNKDDALRGGASEQRKKIA